MYEPIHQPIQVTAKFGENGVEIIDFYWQNKKYDVSEITLTLKARHGREAVWIFHVTTHNAAFKLRFNTDSLKWWLEELTWDIEKDIIQV